MIQRFVKKLPAILQTEVQKEFYAATFDQLFNPANVEQAQGFIGRRTSDVLDPIVDNYLGEPNKNRASYQLEPIAYAVNAALQDSNHNFYEDLLNYIKHRGGNIANHDRLFSDLYYSFSPPIDVDKFLNYQNYLWLEADDITNTAPTAFIQAPLWDAAMFDDYIATSIIGSIDFNTSNNANITPSDFQFSSGMRIQFVGSGSYDRPLYIECVGRSIRLVEDLSPLGFDRLFDELGNRLPTNLSVADYLTVERGSCEGSPWTRSNRWFHEDAVDSITALGQLLGGTVIDGGVNYSVGDPLLVNIGDGANGVFFVSSIAVGGVITSVGVLSRGTGYSFAQHDGAGSIPAVVEPLEWDNESVGGLGSSWDPNNIATRASGFLTSIGQTQVDFDNVSPNGTYAGGASHVIGDFVTLDDGTIIEVINVLLGVVTEFIITTSSTSLILSQGTTQSQTGSTGPGTNFSLTLDTNNELGVTLWDDNTIVTGDGSGALIDGLLASAVSRSNKATRPILEFKKDIELYDFGNRYIGEVTVVAQTESLGDIEGQAAGLSVDGHVLVNDDTLIFLNPISVPTFQDWDKDPDLGFGGFGGTRWDESGPVTLSNATALAFADVGSADTITGSGGGVDFLAEGFTPGQVINIAGTASNDGDYEIAAAGVTTTVITLAATESLVNEGAIASTIRGYHITAAGTTAWDVSGSAGALTRFVWHVDLVTNPGTILLERIDLETGIFPSSITVDIAEDVLILEGDTYQGDMFYQFNDLLTSTFTWEQAQRKEAANSEPLFNLYDGDGITLDDSIAYPLSTFAGNEIYSYKILTQERLTEQGGGVLVDDSVLGFPLETKGFRQLGDVIFENDLEVVRVDYTPALSVATEIAGYYFFKVFNTDPADCTILGSVFETNWQSSTGPEELRVIDRFLTTSDDEDTFPMSGVPVELISGPANFVVTQGRRLNTSEFAYIPESNSMKLLAKSVLDQSAAGTGSQAGYTFNLISEDFELYVDGLYQTLGTDLGNSFTNYIINSQSPSTGTTITFVTAPADGAAILAREQASGAPGQGKVVELLTYTFDSIADSDLGYFEIPNELENNPNNLELLEQSWNEYTPHYTSIITEQAVYEGTAFGAGNNYRDTLKDGSLGTFILQNQSPLLKTMLCTATNDLDIVDAMRLSATEYTRYKNKFIRVGIQLIKEGFTPQQLGDQIPVSEWVDEAIRRIIRAREFDTAFNDTYMTAWNTVYDETVFVGTGATFIYSTTNFTDLEDKRNVLYVYIDEILQAVDKDYEITNLNPIQITLAEAPVVGANIRMRLFTDSSAAHIPATPTKLGLYTASVPQIITDDTYAVSTQFILGHDGSRTPVYNSIIDELLLEFETRIYNGIIEKFRENYIIPLQIDTYKPGRFRTTRWTIDEIQDLIKQSFYKWVASNKADYITNGYYDAADPFTWNYKTVVDTNTVDNTLLPGFWRGIFDHYYDSQTPDITPWELLGFSAKPIWWESTALLTGTEGQSELDLFGDNFTGYGLGPYLPSNDMWVDLENGYVRRRIDNATETIVLGVIDVRYVREGLVANSLPVDALGALKASPLLCIGGSLTDPSAEDAQADYNWTDLAPVEYAWTTSEAFPFAVVEALFLARPGEFGEKLWDPEHIFEVPVDNEQIVSSDAGIFKRIGNSTLVVHGEVIDDVPQIQTGYQVWIAGRLKALKKDVAVDFGDLLRTLDVKLGHKMAAFTNKDTLKVFVEGISVTSQASNLLVPAENIDVVLYTGAPVTDYIYSGALIRALANDEYQVFGYDVTAGEFIIVPRVVSAADQDITVGGQPESFTQFAIGTAYKLGVIIRLNGAFYRCIEAHTASTFEAEKWLKLNKLPITGGVSVTYKVKGTDSEVAIPYGHKFNGVQEVFDFLVGLGEAQDNAGWTFETINTANNTINNWVQAAKDFLFWVGTQWEENSLIMLSPMAEKVILEAQEGYIDNVETVINGVYAVIDKNGVAIDPINTLINRVDRRIEIEPDIDQTGIYGLHAITRETENIVTFDNTTVFNDILYDPVLGSRLARLDFRGRRTREWTGKLEAAGFIITANGLLPNYENMVDSIRNYHNTEVVLDNPVIEATARHLIGFDERDYFTDLGILDDAQFQFYQGMVRQKGTRQAVEKMERNKLVTDINNDLTIIEEWALRLDSFGAVCVNNFTEFLIAADEVKVDPQLVQLSYPATESVPPTYAFDSVDDVVITDNDPDNDIIGDYVTILNHGYSSGVPKTYSAGGGTVVGGLIDDTEYYIVVIDDDRFHFALTKSDATSVTPTIIDLTGFGVGTGHTLTHFPTGILTEIDLVSADNTYLIAPNVFITNHPDDTTGSGATAISILDTDSSVLRIDILTGGTGYSHAPYIAIGLPVITATADRATARISFDIVTDDPSDGAIFIDLDDETRWITKPSGVACDVAGEIWPDDILGSYDTTNAGYVHSEDVDFLSFSEASIDSLATAATVPIKHGQTIWVARDAREEFGVYGLDGYKGSTIEDQTETDYNNTAPNGTFFGGSGFVTTEVITLSDGTQVTVATVSSGVVLTFSITLESQTTFAARAGTTLTTVSSNGLGNNDFTLTVGIANEESGSDLIGIGATLTQTPVIEDDGLVTLTSIPREDLIEAQFTIDVSGEVVEAVTIIDGGFGYTRDAEFVVTANTVPSSNGNAIIEYQVDAFGSIATANIKTTSPGTEYYVTIDTVSVNAGGSGYSIADVLTVVGGTGVGATLTVDEVATIATQTYLLFDGVTLDEGTFAAGTSYDINDVITLTDGSTITVDNATISTIALQDETDFDNAGSNGTFTAGTDYLTGDLITMTDGSVIQVTAAGDPFVEPVIGAAITGFSIVSASTSTSIFNDEVISPQLSPRSGGVGFTITLDTNNAQVTSDTGIVTEFTVTTATTTGITTDLDTVEQASTDGAGINFSLTLGRLNQKVFSVEITTRGEYSDDGTLPVSSGAATTVFPSGGSSATVDLTFFDDGIVVSSADIIEPTGWRRFMGNSVRNEGQIYANNILYDYVLVSGSTFTLSKNGVPIEDGTLANNTEYFTLMNLRFRTIVERRIFEQTLALFGEQSLDVDNVTLNDLIVWTDGENRSVITSSAVATLTFADANPDTITRAGGTETFVSEGFFEGQTITITGTASNNGIYTIATAGVEPFVITLISDDTLVAEGPVGGTVTGEALNTVWTASSFSSTVIAGGAQGFVIGMTVFNPAGEGASFGFTYVSDNDIDTWTQTNQIINMGFPSPAGIAYSSSLDLWAAATKKGNGGADNLSYSENDGVSWTSRTDDGGLTTASSSDGKLLDWSPTLAMFLCGGNSGEIAKSTDGKTWVLVSPGIFGSSQATAIHWSESNALFFAGTTNNEVGRSSDGDNWTLTSTEPGGAGSANIISIYSNPNSTRIFVGRDTGSIYYSDDAGDSWTLSTISGVALTSADISSFASTTDGSVLVAGAPGANQGDIIWRSTDNGVSFTSVDVGAEVSLTNIRAYSMIFDADYGFIIGGMTTDTEDTLIITSPDALTWTIRLREKQINFDSTNNPVTIVSTGTTATLTSPGDPFISVGLDIIVSGANESAYNGTFTVTSAPGNDLTYEMLSDPVDTATGTIELRYLENTDIEVLASGNRVGADIVTISYTALRSEELYIETFKFENAFVYEFDTKDTLAQIPVYDPFKGIIPGTADLNLTWKTQSDPARYTNAAEGADTLRLVNADLAFDGDQVGLLWWDQSTSAYLHYEQGTDEYRRDNWGKLFSGSSVDVYEWTRSTSLPIAYTGDGTVRSSTNYTELQEWDPILERVQTNYYFWVKDRTDIPGGVNRTIAAFEVASIISNPSANLYQWFSPVSQSGFMFSGVDGVFTDSDNVFQINFRRSDDERPTHVEWELGRENDPSYIINDIHWDKTVDSLVGYTVPIPIGAEAYTDDVGEFNTDVVGGTDSSGVDGAAETITFKAEHGFSNGDGARYSKDGGSDLIGLDDGVMYYIEVIDATSVYIHSNARQANPLIGVPNPATRVNIAQTITPPLPLLPEVHKLTVESLALNNFNNALPTAADPTMGYLIVPDPTLSAANQLGIRTRPMQTMFFDIFAARRVYVDKINQLTESIILRDENPSWNATLPTNDLWEWVDWYLEGFDETNASPIRQVDDTSDLALLTNPLDGDIVKVIGTRFSLYEYSSDTGLYTLIMREASRLNLLSTIYTNDQSLATALELRELILAIETEVFVNELVVNNNLVYFTMLNYVFSEQDDLDWAFKSTYIFLDQTGQTLSQPRVFQEDPFDSALEYITEAKPYQTKVRDFRVTRATEIDFAEGEATELFRRTTVSMIYNQIRGGDLSVTEMRIAKFEATQAQELGAIDDQDHLSVFGSTSYRGYSTLDNGDTKVYLGAAGRAVSNYRTELVDIQAPTGGITANLEVEVVGNQIINVVLVAPNFGGTGYTNGTLITLTLSSTAGGGNGTGEITYDVVAGVITFPFVSNSGSGYNNGAGQVVTETPLPNTGTTLAEFDPAVDGNPTTTDELEAVAIINTNITDEFFFDYQGSFLQNTSFGGLPTLGSFTIFDGGTGYVVGDILQLDAGSGTPISNAQFRVSAAPGTVISELDLIDGGSYIQTPTVDPVDLIGGTGSGAQLTALIFENGSAVPHDTTPWDQIGFESSVNDPSVTTLDGSPDNLTTTVPGSTQANYDSIFPNGTFFGGTGLAGQEYRANTGSNDYTDLTFTFVGGADTITRNGGTPFTDVEEFTVGQRIIVSSSEAIGFGANDYSNLAFDDAGALDTIIRTGGTPFDDPGQFVIGQSLTVTNADTGANDGTYTITDVDDTTLTLSALDFLTTDGTDATAQLVGFTPAGTSDGTYTIAIVTSTVITLSTIDVLITSTTAPDTTAQILGFDTIIMQDGPNDDNGSNITVDAVNGSGVVTAFTLTGGSTAFIIAGDPILQASSNDEGLGFTLTTGTGNTTEGTFANIPAEETFSGNGSTKEFEITSTVPTFFMFVVVDDIEQVLNVDYFFIGLTLTFVSIKDITGFRTFGAPSTGTNNIQIFTYIEAGDLINPQVSAGITEEMVPLDPRENLIVIADSTDIVLTVAGTGYAVGETLTATGGVRLQTTIAAQDETDFDNTGSNGTFTGGDGAEILRVAPVDLQSLAFDGSTTSDTITRTGGTAFNTLGFAAGQTLVITGSENLGENDGKYTIVNVTASVITLSIGDALKTNVEDTTATLTVGSTAYVVGDIITMTDQSTITIDAIDASGDVTDFTVTTASGRGFQSGTIFSQESIVLIQPDPDNPRYPIDATGFSVTPGTNNEDDFGSPLTFDVVTTSSGPPGPIATFTIEEQGDYFVYPISPFATTADASGVNATFTLTSLSYRIHHDTQQNLTSHRYSDAESTTLSTTIGLTDNLIPVTTVANLFSSDPTVDDPAVVWIGTERIECHGFNSGANQLTGVLRGTRGTHAQTHQAGAKLFDGSEDQVIPTPDIYWVNSATTSYQSGVANQGVWINNGNGNVHFGDVVDTTFVTTDSVVVGDTLRVTSGFNSQIENSYFIKDLIAVGEVSVITVDVAGTGYVVGDVLSVAQLEGALGPSATPAVLEVGGVFGDGSILYVTIVDRGTGYVPGGAAWTVTDKGDGNAQISVTTSIEGVVLALGGDIINEFGRISENYGVTWELDRQLPGGLNAATTVAALFIQEEPGNALPISLSP